MSEPATEDYHCIVCFQCRIKFWVPLHFYLTATTLGPDFSFHCPVGHAQHFTDYAGTADDPDGGEIVKFPVIDGGRA
jgi:hypothetical protein